MANAPHARAKDCSAANRLVAYADSLARMFCLSQDAHRVCDKCVSVVELAGDMKYVEQDLGNTSIERD